VALLDTRTVTTIHQRQRDKRKLNTSLTAFRRQVHHNLPDKATRSQATALRKNAEPGSQAQIHHGFPGQQINPTTGKRHRIWTFVMVLPRLTAHVRPPGDTHGPARLDANACGSVPVLQRRPAAPGAGQPQTGVDKPDLHDPEINKSYAELASHYGTLMEPARASKPKDKPRAERPMPYVHDSYWRGRELVPL